MHTLESGMKTREQGIEGQVFRISGNQMPSPDRKPSAPKGIKTTVYIFELINTSQVSRQNLSPFFSAINTALVKKVETDSNGYFKVQLLTGDYSLFTKKDNLYYANWFDGNNNIAPATVLPEKMTRVEVRVDYDASY
jgi:hypothetical protein